MSIIEEYERLVIAGMSTQVFGDYKRVMNAINTEMENTFSNSNAVVFNLKVINADLEEKPKF